MLQNNRQVEIIKTNIARKVLETLAEMKEREYDEYLKFYTELSRILKEGLYFDFAKRETIADLLLYPSTKTEAGKLTSFQTYVESMKEGQTEIYYITGATAGEMAASPYLEAFREKGYEVLIMTDEIDEFVMNGFEYKGKKLKSVARGDVALGKEENAGKEEKAKKYGKLLDLIKDELKEDVKDVRLSGRLTDSAVCLVTDEGDLDPQMERMLKAMGQDIPPAKRIMEINPDHPVVGTMEDLFEKDNKNALLAEYVRLLYDQALVLEGSKPKDPAAFAKALAKLMVERAAQGQE
jgi:molecular chaperone HtpG